MCFDYGPDKGSKPCVLHIEHLRKKNIRLSASEMMSLIRYFGLLIGHLVPLNDPIWYLVYFAEANSRYCNFYVVTNWLL